jgi:hypothetical protein
VVWTASSGSDWSGCMWIFSSFVVVAGNKGIILLVIPNLLAVLPVLGVLC